MAPCISFQEILLKKTAEHILRAGPGYRPITYKAIIVALRYVDDTTQKVCHISTALAETTDCCSPYTKTEVTEAGDEEGVEMEDA